MSCWLQPQENGQQAAKAPGGVITSPTLLDPVLVLSQQNYLRLLLTVMYI